MKDPWAGDQISRLLTSAFVQRTSSAKRSDEATSDGQPPTVSIDALITFDASGVSGHINHRSLYHGACHWLSSLQQSGHTSPVSLYTLSSVNVARKYSAFLDIVATMLDLAFGGGWRGDSHRIDMGLSRASADVRGANWSIQTEYPEKLVLTSSLGPSGWGRAWKAMTQAHTSQMLWFRYGWILLSRYMVINDLKLVSPLCAAKVGLIDRDDILEESARAKEADL